MSTSGTHHRLLADIGGTNARFAWQAAAGGPITEVASYACAEHPTLRSAIDHYLREHARPAPKAGAIGIATAVTSDRVTMTNHHWSFSQAQLKDELSLDRLIVMNDFSAIAMALPTLEPGEVVALGGPDAGDTQAPVAVLGPGTGLGVSGLFAAGGARRVAIAGEGGHVTLAATNDEEFAVLRVLARRFGHVSAERVVSGPGLVNLYEACCTVLDLPSQALAPADVQALARAGTCPAARAAIEHFCHFLGSTAGNLALTLGARGGVYIAGGIAPRLRAELRSSGFRRRFDAKGRFEGYLRAIPTFLVDTAESPALRGAALALDQPA